jgi:hypothetical protein
MSLEDGTIAIIYQLVKCDGFGKSKTWSSRALSLTDEFISHALQTIEQQLLELMTEEYLLAEVILLRLKYFLVMFWLLSLTFTQFQESDIYYHDSQP